MTNDVLNSLLKEYEQKKLSAEDAAEHRKEAIYRLIPRLAEIDEEIHHIGISTAKNILTNTSFANSSFSSIEILNKKLENLKKEKEMILQNNNYSVYDLQPHYSCRICKDTGYITDKNFNTVMCSCLKQKLLNISFNKSSMNNLEQENFSTFNEFIFSDEVDLSKYRFNISPRKNILNIREKCINFVENFDNLNTKNLLFTGTTGLR